MKHTYMLGLVSANSGKQQQQPLIVTPQLIVIVTAELFSKRRWHIASNPYSGFEAVKLDHCDRVYRWFAVTARKRIIAGRSVVRPARFWSPILMIRAPNCFFYPHIEGVEEAIKEFQKPLAVWASQGFPLDVKDNKRRKPLFLAEDAKKAKDQICSVFGGKDAAKNAINTWIKQQVLMMPGWIPAWLAGKPSKIDSYKGQNICLCLPPGAAEFSEIIGNKQIWLFPPTTKKSYGLISW